MPVAEHPGPADSPDGPSTAPHAAPEWLENSAGFALPNRAPRHWPDTAARDELQELREENAMLVARVREADSLLSQAVAQLQHRAAPGPAAQGQPQLRQRATGGHVADGGSGPRGLLEEQLHAADLRLRQAWGRLSKLQRTHADLRGRRDALVKQQDQYGLLEYVHTLDLRLEALREERNTLQSLTSRPGASPDAGTEESRQQCASLEDLIRTARKEAASVAERITAFRRKEEAQRAAFLRAKVRAPPTRARTAPLPGPKGTKLRLALDAIESCPGGIKPFPGSGTRDLTGAPAFPRSNCGTNKRGSAPSRLRRAVHRSWRTRRCGPPCAASRMSGAPSTSSSSGSSGPLTAMSLGFMR